MITNTNQSNSKNVLKNESASKDTLYSIEYFHIYTDEKIGKGHQASINYLHAAKEAWAVNHDLIILIDNYNPVNHVLHEDEVFDYLREQGVSPRFWAFEGDFTDNAQLLLDNLTNNKLRKSYERYIESHNKYPCSLLTASWYLARLGAHDHSMIRSVDENDSFRHANRLINILPEAYKDVEFRALELILRSNFHDYADHIQDLFYPASAQRKIDLF